MCENILTNHMPIRPIEITDADSVSRRSICLANWFIIPLLHMFRIFVSSKSLPGILIYRKMIFNFILKNQQKISCFVCEEEFCEKRSLDLHMNSHYENEKNYPCKYCSRSYTNRWNLRRHQLGDHKQLYQFSCRNCNEA